MGRPTSLQPVKKIVSLLATLTVLPAIVFCSIAPSAAATDKNSKVPEKAEAIFSNSAMLKPSSTRNKAAVGGVDLNGSSNTSIAGEESGIATNEATVSQAGFAVSNGVVRAVDMVLLPQPLNRFTL